MKVIGLSGKAGHGKDTVANILSLLYSEYDVQRRALADALKEDIFNLLVYNDSGWNTEYWTWRGEGGGETDVGVRKVAFINAIKHRPEIRALLQTYGVAQRAAKPDFWIQRLFTWAERQGIKVLVVPDVRFCNEADAIRERGGLVLRVIRPHFNNGLAPEQQQHASETELDNYEYFAGYIHNDGDFNRLRQQCQGGTLEWYIRKRGSGPAAPALRDSATD